MISISVVSHGQFDLVRNLLDDIERYCRNAQLELILTLNFPEEIHIADYNFPITIIRNQSIKGFGENHNTAFVVAKGDYFCVVNPDIRLSGNVFEVLLPFHNTHNAGVTAPIVVNSQGGIEDSARLFPSPISIGMKAIRATHSSIKTTDEVLSKPDWVAGMFMFFSALEYEEIAGFDERFFLYYEDVDVCARMALRGRPVLVCQAAVVIHDAQRSSHKRLKYLWWHISSMLRFFFSVNYLRLLCR